MQTWNGTEIKVSRSNKYKAATNFLKQGATWMTTTWMGMYAGTISYWKWISTWSKT